jgi:kynurenine formamidase
MIVDIKILEKYCKVDLSQPIDISLTSKKVNSFKSWYCDEIKIKTIVQGDFIGSVKSGGVVNFSEIMINPHANMTHTESVGHISEREININSILNQFHFSAQLITVRPKEIREENGLYSLGDRVVMLDQIANHLTNNVQALIIRTQEDYTTLHNKDHSNTNWPYLSEETTLFIRGRGIKHLLIDQPSVDKEKDGGKLLSHKAFWNYPKTIDKERTITELIAVPKNIKDGIYLLNLSVANIQNDASPSRPVLYKPILK